MPVLVPGSAFGKDPLMSQLRSGGLAMAALALLGFAPEAASAGFIEINVLNNVFSLNPPGQPIVRDATIDVGDTVRWVWRQGAHSTTSVPGQAESWNSGVLPTTLDPIRTFDHTFTRSGVFWYYCIPHGSPRPDGTAVGMAGTVTVREGTVIPEPGSLTLLGLGILGLLGYGRCRRIMPA